MTTLLTQFLREGDMINYTPSTDVTAGDVVADDALLGIAVNDIPANTLGALAVQGIFKMPKASGTVITQWQRVYWDPTAEKIVTVNSSGCFYAGVAETAAGNGVLTVDVILNH